MNNLIIEKSMLVYASCRAFLITKNSKVRISVVPEGTLNIIYKAHLLENGVIALEGENKAVSDKPLVINITYIRDSLKVAKEEQLRSGNQLDCSSIEELLDFIEKKLKG